jgi:hypothetical protein
MDGKEEHSRILSTGESLKIQCLPDTNSERNRSLFPADLQDGTRVNPDSGEIERVVVTTHTHAEVGDQFGVSDPSRFSRLDMTILSVSETVSIERAARLEQFI